MRRLAVLVVVVGAFLAADVAARGWAESKLAERAAAHYPPATSSTASIRSFPFLGRLLAGNTVSEVSFSMENVRAEAVVLSRLDVALFDVVLDRGELFRGRVRPVDVGRGRLSARIDGPSLARATGVDLRFGEGAVEIHREVAGTDVFATAEVTLVGNTLHLRPTSVRGTGLPAADFAVTYEIPGVELFACEAGVRAVPGALIVACTLDDVPTAFLEAAGGRRR